MKYLGQLKPLKVQQFQIFLNISCILLSFYMHERTFGGKFCKKWTYIKHVVAILRKTRGL